MNAYFAERLRALRTERGLSQAALAVRIGRSQSIVAQWEAAQAEPTASSLTALCEVLTVSADYLLGLRDER